MIEQGGLGPSVAHNHDQGDSNPPPATTPIKVLFLDFDGVLNSTELFIANSTERKEMATHYLSEGMDPKAASNQIARLYYIDPQAVKRVQRLLDEIPELRIVISSTWRNLFSLEWLIQTLEHHGLKARGRVIGKTPEHIGERGGVQRGDLIKEWIFNSPHEVLDYAVLDDDDDMDAVREHFFQTSMDGGLQDSHIEAILEKLKNNS